MEYYKTHRGGGGRDNGSNVDISEAGDAEKVLDLGNFFLIGDFANLFTLSMLLYSRSPRNLTPASVIMFQGGPLKVVILLGKLEVDSLSIMALSLALGSSPSAMYERISYLSLLRVRFRYTN